MNRPQYWEDDETWAAYEEWLAKQPSSPAPLDGLRRAIAKAHGDIETEEDMRNAIQFGNDLYSAYKDSMKEKQPLTPPVWPASQEPQPALSDLIDMDDSFSDWKRTMNNRVGSIQFQPGLLFSGGLLGIRFDGEDRFRVCDFNCQFSLDGEQFYGAATLIGKLAMLAVPCRVTTDADGIDAAIMRADFVSEAV